MKDWHASKFCSPTCICIKNDDLPWKKIRKNITYNSKKNTNPDVKVEVRITHNLSHRFYRINFDSPKDPGQKLR